MATPQRTSPFVYSAVVLAIIVGVVAAILVGGSTSPPAQHAGELVVNLPDQVWGLLFLSPLLIGLAGILLQRLLSQAAKQSRRVYVQLVVVLVLALLFLYLVAHLGSGGGTVVVVGGSQPSNNTTANLSQNHSHPAPPGGATGLGSSPTWNVPGWVLLGIVGAVSACVGLLAVPGVIDRLVGHRRRHPGGAGPSTADRLEAQAAVAEASKALELGADPRTTIVRLYLRLLHRFGPRLGDVSHLTPEEIRTRVLAPLHVRPGASEALTRLFEEARYSVHPMGIEAADRCREALGSVEADLGRLPAAQAS